MSLKDLVIEAKKKGYSKEDLLPTLLKKGFTESQINQAFQDSEKSPASPGNYSMFDKFKLLFSPDKFFHSVKDQSIKKSFLMFLAVSATSFAIVSLFWATAGRLLYNSMGISNLFSLLSIFPFIIFFAISLASTFVYSAVSHIIVLISKGEGKYLDTYNACTYSLVPFVLFSLLLPYIGALSIIYSIFLMTQGLSEYHKISKGKAVVSAITPVLLIIAVLAALFILLISAISSFI